MWAGSDWHPLICSCGSNVASQSFGGFAKYLYATLYALGVQSPA